MFLATIKNKKIKNYFPLRDRKKNVVYMTCAHNGIEYNLKKEELKFNTCHNTDRS